MGRKKRLLIVSCMIALFVATLMLCACWDQDEDGYEKDLDIGTPMISNGEVHFWVTNTSEENIYGVSFVVEIYDSSSKKVLQTVKTNRRVLAPGAKALFIASCQYSGTNGVNARIASVDIGRYAND